MGLLRWESTVAVKELADAANLEETGLEVLDKRLVITRNTPYEELLVRIQKDPLKLKGDICRQIMSAYFFLRMVLKIPHQAINIDDFEAAIGRLKELASLSPRSDLGGYFLKNGYLYSGQFIWLGNFEQTYFHEFHPFVARLQTNNGQFAYYEYETFAPDPYKSWIDSSKYPYVFPPNIIELINEIYAKRYPDQAVNAEEVNT